MACDIQAIILIIIAAILSAGPPILIKKYVNNNESNIFLLGLSLLCSILLIIIYIKLLRKFGASQMYTIIKILSIIIVAVIGFLFLQEKFSAKKVIGILFGIVALVLLI